jgi:putative spermidine/putrescine transport system permease protein
VLLDWAPAIPFLAVCGVLLLGSAAWLVVRSLQDAAGGFTLDNWRDIFALRLNRTAILTSVRLALVVATLTALVGTPLSWFVAHLRARGRSVGLAVANVAANFGGAPLAFAFIATLGATGFLRLVAGDLGLPLGLDLFGFWGYVLVYLYFHVPLFMLLVMPAMGALRPEWWEAAQTAAATRGQFWRLVGVPVLAPFVAAGWVLTFTWAAGQFTIAFALAGSQPKINLITLRIGSFLLSATSSGTRFQRAAAMSVLLIVIAGGALVVYRALARRALATLQGRAG